MAVINQRDLQTALIMWLHESLIAVQLQRSTNSKVANLEQLMSYSVQLHKLFVTLQHQKQFGHLI